MNPFNQQVCGYKGDKAGICIKCSRIIADCTYYIFRTDEATLTDFFDKSELPDIF